MKQTNQDLCGSSYHGHTISSTLKKLTEKLGEPTFDQNTGDDKVNVEWELETSKGIPFTIYDWKLYRVLDEGRIIDFHIGGFSRSDTFDARAELKVILN